MLDLLKVMLSVQLLKVCLVYGLVVVEVPKADPSSVPVEDEALSTPTPEDVYKEISKILEDSDPNDTEELIRKFEPVPNEPFSESSCKLDDEMIAEIASYQDTVTKIIEFVTKGAYKGTTFETLAELVDTFGPRMTGSQALKDAIDWVVEFSKEQGLENIHTESFSAPHWVRNNESLYLLSPRVHRLNILGLGNSVGTGQDGIEAEVLVVDSFEQLRNMSNQAIGKIIAYNQEFVSYGETVKYRGLGASEAAKVGAVGALVRSIAPFSINSPHTGHQGYESGVKKIPVACITIEDAEMMSRMQRRGQKIVVRLTMNAESFPDIVTQNTVAEVVGREIPDEVVLVGGHLDSWDVGQGAMDDGGGSFISLNSAVVLRKLGLTPRRTLRTVLFSAEEQGLIGGFAYFKAHLKDKDKFQLLLESDIGTFNPEGLAFTGSNSTACILKEILKLTHAINTTQLVTPMDGGPDIVAWTGVGVPSASLYNSNSKYFWYHHTNGDMMTVEDKDVLDRCTAMWASLAYVAADLSFKLPHS